LVLLELGVAFGELLFERFEAMTSGFLVVAVLRHPLDLTRADRSALSESGPRRRQGERRRESLDVEDFARRGDGAIDAGDEDAAEEEAREADAHGRLHQAPDEAEREEAVVEALVLGHDRGLVLLFLGAAEGLQAERFGP